MQFIRWSNSLFVFSLLATLSTEQWQGQWHQLGRWQQDIQPPFLPQNVWPFFSPQGVLPQNVLRQNAFPQDVESSSDPLAPIPNLPKPDRVGKGRYIYVIKCLLLVIKQACSVALALNQNKSPMISNQYLCFGDSWLDIYFWFNLA